ncbi:MAG TPA: hypothetical protein VL486_10950 [Verrucomicrobiae bacterium]|nr:hypothetical protein [Verrucomicrobiae bacterium]
MAKNETRRISPQVISDDLNSLTALRGIEDYDPRDEDYTVKKLDALKTAMETAQEAETRAEATLKAARDDANAAEWEFHNAMLRVKQFVIAQFGEDSNEVHAVGLKKKSEYRTPTRNSKTEPASAVGPA